MLKLNLNKFVLQWADPEFLSISEPEVLFLVILVTSSFLASCKVYGNIVRILTKNTASKYTLPIDRIHHLIVQFYIIIIILLLPVH